MKSITTTKGKGTESMIQVIQLHLEAKRRDRANEDWKSGLGFRLFAAMTTRSWTNEDSRVSPSIECAFPYVAAKSTSREPPSRPEGLLNLLITSLMTKHSLHLETCKELSPNTITYPTSLGFGPLLGAVSGFLLHEQLS